MATQANDLFVPAGVVHGNRIAAPGFVALSRFVLRAHAPLPYRRTYAIKRIANYQAFTWAGCQFDWFFAKTTRQKQFCLGKNTFLPRQKSIKRRLALLHARRRSDVQRVPQRAQRRLAQRRVGVGGAGDVFQAWAGL